MSYVKMIIMVLMCAVFQDGIQATHMTRAGTTYARTRINLNKLHHPGLLKLQEKNERLPASKDSTANPTKPAVTTPTASSSSVVTTTKELSSAKRVIFSLLDQHRKILVDLAVVVASLNLDGVDLTDLLAIKDAFRNNPLLPTALSIKLQTIIAKQESLALRSKFLRTQKSFNVAKTLK